ncbi:MAG: sigma-54-dependent Fis family transcriptional regulator, partial [bacterium]|nr:sigma-54-dependent Fis family transcriptional regulator [bacterium]
MNKTKQPPLPVLVVDDEVVALTNYEIILHSEGITNIVSCADSLEVMPLLSSRPFDTVLLDLIMPGVSGEDLLTSIIKEFPGMTVIIITAVDDTETIVRCMKAGAFDFIVKPVARNRLITSLKRAIDYNRLKRENISLKSHLLSPELKYAEAFSAIITASEKMKSIFHYMEVIAGSSEPVLITGETGVGKELFARAFRRLGREKKKFITVNVAGLDDNLFSDTLFGHVKGGFTDAGQVRKGLVEQAENGILFLDEIGDLSQASQVKLLRLIQEHEYYPIGADVPKFSNARVIVATNKNLQLLQQEGKFRDDVYYRLCVHHIQIPPLRERTEDIPLLLDHFLEEAAKDLGKKKPAVPKELAVLLSTYEFPGNVREFRAMVIDAVSRHTSRKMSMQAFKKAIKRELPHGNNSPAAEEPEDNGNIRFPKRLPTLKEAGELLVMEAMNRAQNNQSIAARLLAITRQALN